MKRTAFLLTSLCIAASALAQGLYWQTKTEGSVAEGTTENYAIPKMFKTVSTGGANDGTVMILRLDKKVFWSIDAKKKTYSEVTFDEMEAILQKAGGKMDAAMEKMKKEMEGMPKEQREMMMKMMGGNMPGADADAAIDVKRTAEKKRISGYDCAKYVVRRGGSEFMSLWVTKDVRGFDNMMADWKEFAKRMSAMSARFGKGITDAYKDIDGFPMQTTMTMMNTTVTNTVTKIEQRAISAKEFEVPAGYTKVKSDLEDAMKKMESDED